MTNLGMFGIDQFGAVISSLQSAILAVGRIAERPAVEKRQVVAKPTIKLPLPVAHHVLDGVVGTHLLQELQALLEKSEHTLEALFFKG